MLNVNNAYALALIATLATACSSDNDPTPNLTWSACETGSTLECTTLRVPKDYGNIDGDKIDLALIRKAASGDQSLGALLFNPGGPGGSGIELIEAFEEIGSIPDAITAAYDIVSFDPRGIGQSTPVECSEIGSDNINGYPIDAIAVREVHTAITNANTACFQQHGEYLQQLGSLNVVRDMDEMRKALGEVKLNFIGYSYGTRLAALYLQTYPTTSGRMVLDGSVDPDSSLINLFRGSLPQLDTNLRSVLSQCTESDDNCDVDQLMNRLVDRVSQISVDPSAEGREEFGFLADIIVEATQSPEFGDLAAETLIEYINSFDPSVFDRFVTQLEALGFLDDEEGDEDNETAGVAVLCADDAARPDADTLVSLLSEFNQISDAFAEAQVTEAGLCADWPTALEPLPIIATSTAPVSLVIGGTTDAQTPLTWSEKMAESIGGIFIRSEHDGHTSVFNEQSDCIDAMVEQFLLDGLAPADTVCLAD